MIDAPAASTRSSDAVSALKTSERKRLSWAQRLPLFDTLLSLAAGLLIWELLGQIFNAPSLPPVSRVLTRLWQMIGDGLIINSLGSSLINWSRLRPWHCRGLPDGLVPPG